MPVPLQDALTKNITVGNVAVEKWHGTLEHYYNKHLEWEKLEFNLPGEVHRDAALPQNVLSSLSHGMEHQLQLLMV